MGSKGFPVKGIMRRLWMISLLLCATLWGQTSTGSGTSGYWCVINGRQVMFKTQSEAAAACSASGSGSSTVTVSPQMQQAVTDVLTWLLTSNTAADAQKREFIAAMKARSAEAQEAREFELARQMQSIADRLTGSLKLSGTPDLQFKGLSNTPPPSQERSLAFKIGSGRAAESADEVERGKLLSLASKLPPETLAKIIEQATAGTDSRQPSFEELAAQAEDAAREMVKQHPGDAFAYSTLASVFRIEGKNKEAVDAAMKALQLEPGNRRVREQVAKLTGTQLPTNSSTERPEPVACSTCYANWELRIKSCTFDNFYVCSKIPRQELANCVSSCTNGK
jgi:hypothetical protein